MKWSFKIMHKSRLDLLIKAVKSYNVHEVYDKLVITDVSDNFDLKEPEKIFGFNPKIIRPKVHISSTDNFNLYYKECIDNEDDVMFWTHSDIFFLGDDVLKKFMERVEKAFEDPNWWIYSDRWYVIAWRISAIKKIGLVDPNLPNYFSDNDQIYRAKLAGYHAIYTEKLPIHHEGSQTIASDPMRNTLNMNIFADIFQRYYIKKWGGTPGQEKFVIPFNNDAMKNYLITEEGWL